MALRTAYTALSLTALLGAEAATIPLQSSVPSTAARPVLSQYISLAVEFSLFPDLANSVNNLTQNLISHITLLQNAVPILRVGGTSQDHATYSESITGAQVVPMSTAQDKNAIQYGPGFLDAFRALSGIPIMFGLNLGEKNLDATDAQDLLRTEAEQVCQRLATSVRYWELGNEPDLYTAPDANHGFRTSYNAQQYVNDWLNKSALVTQTVSNTAGCGKLVQNGKLPFVAPSIFNVETGNIKATALWQKLGQNGNIDLVIGHVYIDDASNKAVTLQGTLMNHTRTKAEINNRLNVWNQVTAQSGTRFVFNEVGSLVTTGAPNISDVFGAALWTMDFSLFAASAGVGRLHWQQGTNFWYNAWQPVTTSKITAGTKAPYYGLFAATDFIGDSATNSMQIIELQVDDPEHSSSYALYRNGTLERLAVIQLTAHESSASGRGTSAFIYQLPTREDFSTITRQFWLAAEGSDVEAGIVFGKQTYETSNGMPDSASYPAGSVGTVTVSNGILTVNMPDSSALVLQFGS